MPKSQHRFVALLRGINVGGNNIIPMTQLKATFEDAGCDDVTTYIQCGNVVFSSSQSSADRLAEQLESILGETFNYHGRVAVLSQAQYTKSLSAACRLGAR
ncbi:MAG: DUF1697 domain-containing protein [Pirellulaceae bacterium]